MPTAPIPLDEVDRLKALHACKILDTPAEAAFDDLTAIAAHVAQVPIALVSLVDAQRQWFKSKVGLCASETPRDQAFCAYAIHRSDPLLIPDATLDERMRDNPLVTGAPFIRFYAGFPLIDADGFALGTLCVIDTRPRELSVTQIESLQSLARQAVHLLAERGRLAAEARERSWIDAPAARSNRAAYVTFATSMCATALAVLISVRSERAVAQQKFAGLSAHVLDEIPRRIKLPVYGLAGARGVYAASKSVERNEFAAYVRSRNLPVEFPGVLGIGFLSRTTPEGLDAFLQAERADDAPTFAIHSFSPAPPTRDDGHNELYVVTRLYPAPANQADWGLDMGSDAARRETIERAIRTGAPALSPPLTVTADGHAWPGCLYMVPVYRNGRPVGTTAERVAALDGVLFAKIVTDGALANLMTGDAGMIDVEVLDVDVPTDDVPTDGEPTDGGPGGGPDRASPGSVLFASAAPQQAGAAAARPPSWSSTSRVDVGGRTWSVRTSTNPRFNAAIDHAGSYTAGLAGTALSVLLSLFVGMLGRSRARAFRLAEQMTADLRAAKELSDTRTLALKQTADILRRTGELARVGGWELDLQSNHLTWSDEVYRIHELPPGTPVTVQQAIAFYSPESRPLMEAAVQTAIHAGTPWDLELPFITASGKRLWVRAQGEYVREASGAKKLRGAFQDITDRRTAAEQLQRSATHDKLTGLPNRALLNDRIQQCLTRAAQHAGRGFAVLFMDFDRFKLTNDTLGHEAGDELLKQIARRLRAGLRAGDTVAPADAVDMDTGSTVGRLGGDEFVVVLDRLADPADATLVADRLLGLLAAPYTICGHQVVSTASIGIVTGNAGYARPDEVLRDADIAMYEAKNAGKARYVVFDAAMHQRLQRRAETEADLRKAVERGELFLAFQPITLLASGENHGVEALIRWRHPTRGEIRPDELIPIAEESGLIIPIGEWVLRTACEQFVTWHRTLGDRAPKSVSVNLSRKQLAIGGLVETVAGVLRETGMEPGCLNLEVTESAVMKDPAAATLVLGTLRKLGVKIHMDDFGTGHSSLSMLHQFPIDVLKIDRSFVANLDQGRAFAALVCAIVQLAHNLGMSIVAEGIETPEQLAMLQSLDCEMGQGYLLGRPMTGAAFERLASGDPEAGPQQARPAAMRESEAARENEAA